MTSRRSLDLLGTAFFGTLVLALACTENSATRVIQEVKDAGAGMAGSGARPTGGTGGRGGASGAGGNAGMDGGPGPDACLENCADPKACTIEEQALVDVCRLYAKDCPDQPADVMMEPEDGVSIPAGPDATPTVTRPQLTEAEADALYTIEEAFRGGGTYTVTYSGDGSGAGGEGGGSGDPLGERMVTYEFDEWDPRGPIEDVTKIVPGLVVDPNGKHDEDGTFQTLQRAITEASNVAGCPRVFIKVLPGTYHEKITVPAKTSSPPITIYGVDPDASKIVIVRGDSAAGAEGDGTPLTVHDSATFKNSLPQPFQARNLTIANNYVAGTFEGDPEDQTSVALNNQADRALFDNVRFLGHRNTVYVKSEDPNQVSRIYFRNCYVEGDEEIIFGRGAAVFDQCEIHSVGDRMSTGFITAASTRVDNPHGILIMNSELSADAIVSDAYLGRQWFEQVGSADTAGVGKTIVRNSILGPHIRVADPWAPTTRFTPKTPTATSQVLYTSDDYYVPATGLIPPEVFVAEFGNSGPGAAP